MTIERMHDIKARLPYAFSFMGHSHYDQLVADCKRICPTARLIYYTNCSSPELFGNLAVAHRLRSIGLSPRPLWSVGDHVKIVKTRYRYKRSGTTFSEIPDLQRWCSEELSGKPFFIHSAQEDKMLRYEGHFDDLDDAALFATWHA